MRCVCRRIGALGHLLEAIAGAVLWHHDFVTSLTSNRPASIDPYAWIEAAAARAPDRAFAEDAAHRRMDYGELLGLSAAWAAALRDRGVKTGDRVAVQVDKSLEAIVLYAACLRIGAVYVPINTANTPNEVDYTLRDAEPRLAVVRPADLASLANIAEAAGVTDLHTLGAGAEGSLVELARSFAGQIEPRPALPAGALAAILYTSGTTGRAKGALLSRGNLGSNAATLAAAWRFSPADVLLHALPLFHVHGLFVGVNIVLASGASLLLQSSFDALRVLGSLPKATVFMGVPTFFTRLLQRPGLDRASTAHMRLFVSGSAPLTPDTHREFERRTGHVILERYGMTETLMITSNPYEGLRLPGSVGPALPGVDVRIAAPDAAPTKGEAAVGEIEVRGPNVCAGYWRDVEKTASAFTADGWFKTGDLGQMDGGGYVTIVGRAKDLVISGGYNVYPKEVETELDALPGVAESAVFGVPHPDFGEGVTAVVVAKSGVRLDEAEILRAVQSRLARYKLPKRVLVVEELPRNQMGKVQKSLLRTRYAALFQPP
jgi:malonyl-CoA/methylmalonyl-CoA synthetase